MRRLPESTLSQAEARQAFATVVDADLDARRARLAQRMAEAKDAHREAGEAKRRAAFWRGVEAARSVEALIAKVHRRA